MNDWLNRFRDDKSGRKDQRWLENFRDDGLPKPKSPPPPKGAPRAQEPPRPMRPAPNAARTARPQPRPEPLFWGRPQSIVIFAAMMATSLVLGLTATAVAYPKLAPHASAMEILLPDIVVILLIGGLVALVALLRQRWAVFMLAIFCAVRFLLYVPTFFHIDSVSLRLLTICYFILQAAAFWFAFTRESRDWFRKARRS